MISSRIPVIAVLLVLARESASGQGARPVVPDPLALIGGDWVTTIAPTGGMIDGEGEIGAGASVDWVPGDPDSRASLRLSTGGVRARQRSWAGASAELGWAWLHGPVSSWVSGAAYVGSGDGASTGASASLSGRYGMLTLELRSTWLSRSGYGETLVDSVRVTPAWFEDPRGRYTDAQLTAAHHVGPAMLEGTAGLRFGEGSREDRWAHLTLSVPLSRQTDIFANGGVRPDRPERGELGGSFLMLGMRLRPRDAGSLAPIAPPATAPVPALEIERTPNGWTFTIRVPGASSVELNGDLTSWTPARMTRSSDDAALWQLSLDVPSGIYLVALRVDGGVWAAPPGIAAVPDGFGGQAGLLELQPRK